jgi:hypothetical protein
LEHTEPAAAPSGGEWRERAKELANHAWTNAANAYRMYPNNKHSFSSYWGTLGEKEADKLSTLKGERGEWISVEEGLPEYMDCVIIYNEYGCVHEAQYTGEKNLFMAGDCERKATHWQPLPPAPKAQTKMGEV